MGHYDYEYQTLNKEEIQESIESMEKKLEGYYEDMKNYREDHDKVVSSDIKWRISEAMAYKKRDIKDIEREIEKYKEGLEGKCKIQVVVWS